MCNRMDVQSICLDHEVDIAIYVKRGSRQLKVYMCSDVHMV